MKSPPQWALAALLFLPAMLSAQDIDALVDGLTGETGWSLASDLTRYSEEDLDALFEDRTQQVFDYGFRDAAAFDLAGATGTPVSVKVYEMIDSTAAYGLFAMERDHGASDFEIALVGTESYRQGDVLVFWQSSYVVRLDGARSDTEAVAGFLTTRVSGLSRKAPVSFHLPPDALIPASETYILTASALEAGFALNAEDLGFENSVEVAAAEYSAGGATARLALLMYPTPQLASMQTELWLESRDLLPPSRRVGPLLGIVTESTSPELTEAILAQLTYQTETTWSADSEAALTLPELILSIFMWIGVAALFTIVVGIGFGGFRIYMKARHPGQYFPSDETVNLVQLKINQSVAPKELGQ